MTSIDYALATFAAIMLVGSAVNVIWVDDNGSAYIRSWTCPHGIDDEEPCDACEVVR